MIDLRSDTLTRPTPEMLEAILAPRSGMTGAPTGAAAANLAHRYGVPVRMDGARLMNAAVALRIEPASLCRDVDTVMFCLSKGLSAPVGSLVCGGHETIVGTVTTNIVVLDPSP